jgi:subtilisin
VFHSVGEAFVVEADAELVAELERHPLVESVVPSRVVRAHKKPDGVGKPGGGDSEGQVVPAGVERIGAAPGAQTVTGAGVGIAIIDNGVDNTHADLTVSAECFLADGIGGTCFDDGSHGTHVAGIAAAKNNDIDVVGVAPDATVYSVRVLGLNGGTDDMIIAGLQWVLNNANTVNPPIKVANMSLGRPGTADDNSVMRDAVAALQAAGITVVTSAGNDETTEASEQVPAAYAVDYGIGLAVASTTALDGDFAPECTGIVRDGDELTQILADTAASYTTDGVGCVSAPGSSQENVTFKKKGGGTCYLEEVGILSLQAGGGTTEKYGTSMASPLVAGVAALHAERGLTEEQVRTRIRNNADGKGSLPIPPWTGFGTDDGEAEGIVTAD